MTTSKPTLPRPDLLRWEITAALLIKLILLIGLWFMIFRWLQRPDDKPDIAKHFDLPALENPNPTDFSSQH